MKGIELIDKMAYLQPAMALRCQTEIHIIKDIFVDTIKNVCPDFVIDDFNREVVATLFDWCIRNVNGAANPMKGLWLYGGVGTGKSTLMRAVLEFVGRYWLRDSGERISPRWIQVPHFCGKYATNGFSVFDSIPMGLDELGTEITPTNYVGNKLNVMAHLMSVLYDQKSPIPHIVTTNLNIREVYNAYGPRTIDRIGALFTPIKLSGATRRDTSAVWDIYEAELKAEEERNKNL